jgi:hypothetical protein
VRLAEAVVDAASRPVPYRPLYDLNEHDRVEARRRGDARLRRGWDRALD